MNDNTSEKLIETLCHSTLLAPAGQPVQLMETHISWILLTGEFAWKIKKPVNLGFVDFTTLEKRAFFCQEELRLNRRLAAELYLEVVGFSGTPDHPMLVQQQDFASAKPFEYAVKIKEFPQENLLPAVLKRGELKTVHLEQLARTLARFHQAVDRSPETEPQGTPEEVCKPQHENLRILRQSPHARKWAAKLDHLEQWSNAEHQRLRPLFAERKSSGKIRECHGDLHLGNMVLLEDRITVFDCIEFNPDLRWIDIISEIAFLVMDLEDRGCPEFAFRFLNAWLEQTGDYAGLQLLPYSLCYRALVRAKVKALRLAQSHITSEEHVEAEQDLQSYLNLAERFTHTRKPFLLMTHGVSGVGKTTISGELMEQFQAIRLRSDVERKRLHGLDPLAPGDTKEFAHIYFPEATRRTFRSLRDQARLLVQAGYPVIIDATNLLRWHRQLYSELASEMNVPFVILDLQADLDRLEMNLHQRKQGQVPDASDAGIEVMRSQLQSREPLTPEELLQTVSIDTGTTWDRAELFQQVREKIG